MPNFASVQFAIMGRDSSVGIATRYRLDSPGIESRWEARFSAHVQTGPVAHPACCTVGTGSFTGVKRSGRGVALTTHPQLQCRGLKLGRAIPLPTLRGLVACKGGTFTFTLQFAIRFFLSYARGPIFYVFYSLIRRNGQLHYYDTILWTACDG